MKENKVKCDAMLECQNKETSDIGKELSPYSEEYIDKTRAPMIRLIFKK